MRTIERDDRIAFEEVWVKEYLPEFKRFGRNGIDFFSGWIMTELNKYQLRLMVDPDHPYRAPKLFLVSPKALWMYGHSKTINSLGLSRSFHTESDILGGRLQILHSASWDASCTCAMAIMRGIIWIKAYEGYLRRGKSIAHILRDLEC